MRCPQCGEELDGDHCLSCGYDPAQVDLWGEVSDRPPDSFLIWLRVERGWNIGYIAHVFGMTLDEVRGIVGGLREADVPKT